MGKKTVKITKQKRRIEGGMNRTNEDKENVSEVRRWPKLEKNSTHEPALKLGYLTPQNCIRELGGTWWRNPDFPFQAGTEERRNKFSDLTRALTACLSMGSKICYRLLFQENWWKVHHCMCVSVCACMRTCVFVCVCVERVKRVLTVSCTHTPQHFATCEVREKAEVIERLPSAVGRDALLITLLSFPAECCCPRLFQLHVV